MMRRPDLEIQKTTAPADISTALGIFRGHFGSSTSTFEAERRILLHSKKIFSNISLYEQKIKCALLLQAMENEKIIRGAK